MDPKERKTTATGNFPVELSADEQRMILAYRDGKAVKAINLLKAQGDLPASFPTRPDKP